MSESPTLIPNFREKSVTFGSSISPRAQQPSLEEIKEVVEKSKEYLRINKNISCFYLLNRIVRLLADSEIDIRFRFQIFRSYCESISRIIIRLLVKHPEKNDKNIFRLNSLMQKGFMALEEWNQLLLLYLLEFNDSSQNKISQQILKEIAEKIQPLFKSDREKLFGIKVIDDTNDIERPPDLRMQKNEEIHSKNIVKHVKYRKLTGEESKNAIKFDFYMEKFLEYYFYFCLIFALIQKKKKAIVLAGHVLKTMSSVLMPFVLKQVTLLIFNYQFLKKKSKILGILLQSQLLLASLYCENGLIFECLSLHNEIQEIFRAYFTSVAEKEIFYRRNNKLAKFKTKIKNSVRKISLSFIFQSIIFEATEKYDKSLECLKFIEWLASAFLDEKDEVFILVSGLASESRKKYDVILHEKGEISNILQIFQSRFQPPHVDLLVEEVPKIDPIIEIMQESDLLLYNKFKKQADNASFIIVKSNTLFSDLDATGAKSGSIINANHSNVKEVKIPIEETQIQDRTKLFEVSLEPSYNEQNLTSKRLSITKNRRGDTSKLIQEFGMMSSSRMQSSKMQDSSMLYGNEDNINLIKDKKSLSAHAEKKKEKNKLDKKVEDFPNKSTILTTLKYFKTQDEIRRIIEGKHKRQDFNELEKSPTQVMHNLDDYFGKKINEILVKKCQNRSMKDVHETFQELQKDEDFDKKEFDFSKKMLRHKKSYSMGKIKSEFMINQEERDQLNFIHPRREVRNEIKELWTKHNIKSRIDQTKSAQEEEKTANMSLKIFERSSVAPPLMFSSDQKQMNSSTLMMNKSKEKEDGMLSSNLKSISGKEEILKGKNLQSIVMKHRVTFEFKKMLDVQRKISLSKKSGGNLSDIKRKTRSGSIMKRRIVDDSKDAIARHHQNTKDMIQLMAENLVKDIELCDHQIEKVKNNLKDKSESEEKNKISKQKELKAKKIHLVKINNELCRSVKNLAFKKEMLENLQNQLTVKTKRPSQIFHAITLNKLA